MIKKCEVCCDNVITLTGTIAEIAGASASDFFRCVHGKNNLIPLFILRS